MRAETCPDAAAGQQELGFELAAFTIEEEEWRPVRHPQHSAQVPCRIARESHFDAAFQGKIDIDSGSLHPGASWRVSALKSTTFVVIRCEGGIVCN